MQSVASRRNWLRKLVAMALLIVALVAVFEIGVRLLTPDAVHYETQLTNNGGPAITKSGTITDPATVARWHAAATATPSGKLLFGQGPGTCAPLSYYSASYVFLWHGLTLETVATLPVCGEQYEISSGGLPDLRTYYVPHLIQP